MNITNVSVEAKKTLDFLTKNFPEIIDCVPNDVLEFGIPNQYMTTDRIIYIYMRWIPQK